MESIDKIKRLADIVSKNTAPSSNTNTLIGNLLKAMALYMAEQHHGAVGGYQFLNSIEDLPTGDLTDKQKRTGYVVGENIYFYVGTDGDTLNGEYQNGGSFHGTKGDDGLSAYEIWKAIDPNNANKTEGEFLASLKQSGIGYDYAPTQSAATTDNTIYAIPDEEDENYWYEYYRKNGTLYFLGKHQGGLGEILSYIKELSQGNNLLYIHGYINVTTGNITDSEDYRCSDYIYIDGKEPILISDGHAGPSSALIAFYDENRGFISCINDSNGVDISANNIPERTVFIRIGTSLATSATIKIKTSSILSNAVAIGKNIAKMQECNEKIDELQESIDEIENSIIKEENELLLTNDGYYYTDGRYNGTQNAKNTGKVSLDGYDRLDYSTKISTGACAVAFFDENDNILSDMTIEGRSGLISDTIDLTDSAYENAKSVVICYYDNTHQFEFYVGRLRNSKSASTKINELQEITSSQQKQINLLKEQIPKDELELELTENGWYDSDGTFRTSSNGKGKSTAKIAIDGYDRLDYTANINNVYPAISFWDENEEIISNLSIFGGKITGTIDLSESQYENVKYIAIAYYDSNYDFSGFSGKLYRSDSLGTQIIQLSQRIGNIEKLNPIKDTGLNILIFGDSITDFAAITIENDTTTSYTQRTGGVSYTDSEGNTVSFAKWPYLIQSYLDCFDVRNYAMSGASFKDINRDSGLERRNLSYQVTVALNDVMNPNNVFPTNGEYIPDIVIFALGTNDNTPNDTYESAMEKTIENVSGTDYDIDATLNNLDRSKFCEAARHAFIRAKRQFPYAVFICILPIQKANKEQGLLNTELRKMAERYGMIIIDGNSEMGIIRDFEHKDGTNGVYLKDGLHPNENGQKLMARTIINAIKNNYIPMK